MRTTLIVDGEFQGKGIRGEPIFQLDPKSLHLPESFSQRMAHWLSEYASLHKSNYADQPEIERLDAAGMQLAMELQQLVGPEFQVYYYSDARTTKYVLDNGQFRIVRYSP